MDTILAAKACAPLRRFRTEEEADRPGPGAGGIPMRWFPFLLALALLGTAEAGRYRQGKASFYRGGRPGLCAVRHGLAKKGQRIIVQRGRRQVRLRVCCSAPLRRGRVIDLHPRDFRRLGGLPSRGLIDVRVRITRRR